MTLSLPVFQNAHVNSVCEKVYCIRCLFYFSSFSLLTLINTKGNMLLMDRNLNPFATLNKQGHIINRNIPVALRCVTFFSHTSEPTSVLFSYKRTSNYITDNQYLSC